jgi:hypothetical protein
MKILSIDVGIKNLAFCLFEKSLDSPHFNITKWDVVNISEEEETLKCCFVEKQVRCDKPAKFFKDGDCFCLKHSKKQPYQIPTAELKQSFINKQKNQKLHDIAGKYNIPYEKSIKKPELISLINQYITQTCFTEVKKTNASKIDLIKIGWNMKTKFQNLFANEDAIDYVIIENQISPIANRMKTIQGMIVQYFIMSTIKVDHIEFISAANKLKDCPVTDNKTSYSNRKKLGIAKCLEIITNDPRLTEKVNYFNTHKKKDDLSDSFLQGMWFIVNRKL